VGSKIGVAGRGCEMPFGSKLIIKIRNECNHLVLNMRILGGDFHAARGAQGKRIFIMQTIYQAGLISDF
jgi:hypothetical protein